MLRENQIFDRESNGETRQTLSFCAGSKSSKWTRQINDTKPTNIAPESNFHSNGRGILTIGTQQLDFLDNCQCNLNIWSMFSSL